MNEGRKEKEERYESRKTCSKEKKNKIKEIIGEWKEKRRK